MLKAAELKIWLFKTKDRCQANFNFIESGSSVSLKKRNTHTHIQKERHSEGILLYLCFYWG